MCPVIVAAPTACLLNSTTSLSYAGGAQRQDFHFTTHLVTVTVIVTDTAGHPVQGRTITAYNPDDDAITTSDGTIGFTLVKNYQQSSNITDTTGTAQVAVLDGSTNNSVNGHLLGLGQACHRSRG